MGTYWSRGSCEYTWIQFTCYDIECCFIMCCAGYRALSFIVIFLHSPLCQRGDGGQPTILSGLIGNGLHVRVLQWEPLGEHSTEGRRRWAITFCLWKQHYKLLAREASNVLDPAAAVVTAMLQHCQSALPGFLFTAAAGEGVSCQNGK